MRRFPLLRSLFFVPGNNQRFIEKAKGIPADIICLDLEDSVPNPEKENARKMIRSALEDASNYNGAVFVRTNSPQSGLISEDIRKVVRQGIDGIVIPKVNNKKEMKKILSLVRAQEKKQSIKKPIEVFPSIESAEGVFNTYDIVIQNKRISALVFGIFDLLADMGVEYTKDTSGAADYARAKVALDSHAAGKLAIDGIWQDLEDAEGLKRDCEIAKKFGYSGKSIIHPSQVETANKIFYPTDTEIEWAKQVISSYNDSVKKSRGATKVQGKMIDEVHYKRAKAVVELVEKKN